LSLQDLVGGRFGRTSLAWASSGIEAHRLDTMSHTLDDDASLWRP